MKSQDLHQLWRERISSAAQFAGSVTEWCLQNNINPRQFYRRRRVLSEAASGSVSPTFVPVNIRHSTAAAANTGLTVKISGAETEIHSGFDPRKYLQFILEQVPLIQKNPEKHLDTLHPRKRAAQAAGKIPETTTE